MGEIESRGRTITQATIFKVCASLDQDLVVSMVIRVAVDRIMVSPHSLRWLCSVSDQPGFPGR